jgi:thiamine kinase-like enzyme
MSETLDKVRALPCWSGAIAIAPLQGGLSNESWVVRDARGRHVVRFGQDFAFHHVSRERELMAARAAFAAGFAPEIEHAEPGVMVSRWIEAETLDAAAVCARPEQIAEMIRSFHRTMPELVSGPAQMFWVFHVIRDYARILQGTRWEARLPHWRELNRELEAAQVPMPIVFAHNDLLPANFLDDGDRLWLIDFEYAGFSTAMFDLAGVASNAGMDAGQAGRLLTTYLGAEPDAAFLRAFEAMQVASLLREGMWALVSSLHLSVPGVDYEGYAETNFARMDAALDMIGR